MLGINGAPILEFFVHYFFLFFPLSLSHFIFIIILPRGVGMFGIEEGNVG